MKVTKRIIHRWFQGVECTATLGRSALVRLRRKPGLVDQTERVSGDGEGQGHAEVGGVYREGHQEEGQWEEPNVSDVGGV